MNKIFPEFIFSISGWRKIFAPHSQSPSTYISREDEGLINRLITAYLTFLKAEWLNQKICIALGRDSRPTGGAIYSLTANLLQKAGCDIKELGICPSPEISAYVRLSPTVHSYCYITASHNPVGYNGFKFGTETGEILPSEGFHTLRKIFFEENNDTPPAVTQMGSRDLAKKESEKLYSDSQIHSPLKSQFPLGLVMDMNGSARCCSIDRRWIQSMGYSLIIINGNAGEIAHEILPEGSSLQECSHRLEEEYQQDSSFQLGCVVDNDGDRATFLFIDPHSGKTQILSAQDSFALLCFCEMASRFKRGEENGFLIVNGPTSHRIDEMAAFFSNSLRRVEVGEGNILSAVKHAQKQGLTVYLAGEGSNGGFIVPPSPIRDPLRALGTLCRFYSEQLFDLLPKKVTNPCPLDIHHQFPRYTTTETAEPAAQIRLKSSDIVSLKEAYEEIVNKEAESILKRMTSTWNLKEWKQWNYCGAEAIEGRAQWKKSSSLGGGLGISFYDEKDIPPVSIWFRKSGTEPIYRIIADIKGDHKQWEKELLYWQKDVLLRADTSVGKTNTV